MTVQETVLTKLRESFPDKHFEYVMEVDKLTYRPWARLCVDGKATIYGFQPDAIKEAMDADSTLTVEEMANRICRTVVGPIRAGFSPI